MFPKVMKYLFNAKSTSFFRFGNKNLGTTLSFEQISMIEAI